MSESVARDSSDLPRILLVAYACHPHSGSEPGAGWNGALQTARFFPTWVLCDETINRPAIERFVALNGPIANLHFVFVRQSGFEQRLRRLPGLFYPLYQQWHRRALGIAKQLHSRLKFDLVHQLNMCGFREPGYSWKLDAPFVWGPVGGAQNYPWRFLTSAGWKGAISECARNILNLWQMRCARRVGQAARRATVMLTANQTNAQALACRRGMLPEVQLEIGVHPTNELPPRDFHHGGPLRILWSGVFEYRKALHLLLEALAALPADVPYELHILGRGPLDSRWRKIARQLGVDQHCRWLGWLDHHQAVEQYYWADVFAFTSLRDTTGTVVLESLATGTPILCLDHQGVGDIVTNDCGRKLSVTNPREVIAGLRETMIHWHRNRDELERLSCGAVERAKLYDWNHLGESMADVYRRVLEADESSESLDEVVAHVEPQQPRVAALAGR